MLASAVLNLFVALLIGTTPGAFQKASSPPEDLFAQIYNRAAAQQKTMRSIRARFTETTTSSLLVKPIVAHGTVIGASPARVRMTYTDPEAKTIAMDGKTLLVVWAGRRERERIDLRDMQKRIDQYFTHASIDQLRSMFQIAAAPDPTMRKADRIEMIPKRKQIKAGLDRLDLWIDRESTLLVQMRLTFAGGDQKTITLEDIAVNVPVSDETFQIQP